MSRAGWLATPPAERGAALAIRAYRDGDPSVTRRDVGRWLDRLAGRDPEGRPVRVVRQAAFGRAGVVVDLFDPEDGPPEGPQAA